MIDTRSSTADRGDQFQQSKSFKAISARSVSVGPRVGAGSLCLLYVRFGMHDCHYKNKNKTIEFFDDIICTYVTQMYHLSFNSALSAAVCSASLTLLQRSPVTTIGCIKGVVMVRVHWKGPLVVLEVIS